MDTKDNIITVALADDHILLRDALASLINTFDSFQILFTASNGQEVIEKVNNNLIPDIMLLDLHMPVMDGYEIAQWLVKNHPGMHVIILSMFDSELTLLRLVRLGIKAFIKKDVHPNELEYALNTVMKKEDYCLEPTDKNGEPVVNAWQKKREAKPLLLSDNEIIFLKWNASDLTYKEIAKKMCVSEHTISNYRESLKNKLSVKSRTGLAIHAIRNGIA